MPTVRTEKAPRPVREVCGLHPRGIAAGFCDRPRRHRGTCVPVLTSELKDLAIELREVRGELEAREGTLAMTVARLGGVVEGRPTQRGNFLQRIDELVRTEAGVAADRAALERLA